jgi:superfamily II DNA helicase RecQ
MKKEDLVNNILDIVQSITTGKIIIYCLSPRSCNEIKEHLSSKISESIISVYHGELGGEKKHSTIIDWKNGIFKIMIATNAFGLGVNTPDVRAVIHWTFPLNISKYVFILKNL